MNKLNLIKGNLSGLVYHRRLSYFTLAVALIFAALLWNLNGTFVSPAHVTSDTHAGKCCLKVSILDIGQGDSIYIQTPDGHSTLVDAGPAGGQVNARIEEQAGMFDKNIDVLLATHPDADHIGGFQEVLSHFGAGAFVDPGIPDDTATYKNLISSVDAAHIKRIVARRGLEILLDPVDDVRFEILYPDDGFYAYRYDQCESDNTEHKRLHKKGSLKNCKNIFKLETNEESIVGKLIYGNTSFLLTGDAPIDVEQYLMHQLGAADTARTSATSTLRADVLKVGHHGSKNSTSPEFVAAVSPEFAAISVGAKNRYGHPTDQVLQILAAASSSPQVLRTDKVGTIKFSSDGETVTLEK